MNDVSPSRSRKPVSILVALVLLLTLLVSLMLLRSAAPVQASAKSVINLARTASVSADSELSGYTADKAIDGENHSTAWRSANNSTDHWLELDFGTTHDIQTIVVVPENSSTIEQYQLQAWVSGTWQTVYTQPNTPYSSSEHSVITRLSSPVTTDKLRLYDTTGSQARLRQIEVFAADPQPVLLNQSGFDLNKTKRFTAPLADNGDSFSITKEGDPTVLFSGTVSDNIGDFSAFNPASDSGPYIVTVSGSAGTGSSVPFNIGPYWTQRVALQRALDFMIDARCRYGDATTVGPGTNCNLGVAWRDSHQFSWELNYLVTMYAANPSAFTTARMPIQASYTGLRETLPVDTPEIVQLIYWAVEVYLQGDVNHTLLKEQLAYFVYAYPGLLDEYIPVAVYDEAVDYLFDNWDNPDRSRWNWYDISHTADLFQTYTQYGNGKGSFPPGHSVAPNLMMYEVALREGEPNAYDYFAAAYNQTNWIINNLDPADPAITKGQRLSEPILVTGLSFFEQKYPNSTPPGLQDWLDDWADVVIERSDNMWDFRRYSDTQWVIATYNEPGNVAGFPAAALSVAQVLDDGAKADELRRIATAHVDNVFGRNPMGRHFSNDAAQANQGWEGVELGWPHEFDGGAGNLANVRGVLDGAPKENAYPYNPGVQTGYTEGWTSFNSPWNGSLAYMSMDDSAVTLFNSSFSTEVAAITANGTLGIELTAPLNFDYTSTDSAEIQISVSNGDALTLTLTEPTTNSLMLRNTITLQSGAANPADSLLQASEGDVITVSYGFDVWGASAEIPVVASGVTPTPPPTATPIPTPTPTPTPTPPANIAELIVDNSDISAVTLTGSWQSSTFTTGYVGSDYLHDQNTGKGTKSVSYELNVPASAEYELFVRHTTGTNRATNTPVDIVYDGGSTTVTVDQTQNNGQWVSIGTYALSASSPGSVTIRTTGTNGYVIADAVRAVRQDIILDNSDSDYVTITGSWQASTYEPDYIGSNYLHDQNSGKGSKSVSYAFPIAEAGSYEVLIYYNISADRATNVPIDIDHASGSAEVFVDQSQNGAQWVSLGTYTFDTSGATVTIRTTGTSGQSRYVIADAVRLIRQ